VQKELRCFSVEFYVGAHSVSRKGGKSVLIIQGTLWKNNLNFVKVGHRKCVDFIVIVNIVSGKNRIYFYTDLRT